MFKRLSHFTGLCVTLCVTLYDFWKPLIVSHPLTIFNDQSPCGSEYITFLICHLTLHDHVFRGLCDFMGGGPL